MVFERVTEHPSSEEQVFEAPIPATDYGLSKLTGERLSMAFSQQYGMKYVVWRPFNIITPHERAESEQGISHVFADFIKLIVDEQRNPVPVLGDGEQVRCFTWIDDVAQAIAKFSFDEVDRRRGVQPRQPRADLDARTRTDDLRGGAGGRPAAAHGRARSSSTRSRSTTTT